MLTYLTGSAPEGFAMSMGRRIRDRRKKMELSQQELGAIVGVSAVQISRIETGQRDTTTDVLQKIVKALELDTSGLFDDDTEPDATVAP